MKNIDNRKDRAFTPVKAETLATVNGGSTSAATRNWAWRWWQ